MGHYDDQYDYDNWQATIRNERRLIQDVKSAKYHILLDAARAAHVKHVCIDASTFKDMLTLISRLDPITHTFPWEK